MTTTRSLIALAFGLALAAPALAQPGGSAAAGGSGAAEPNTKQMYEDI